MNINKNYAIKMDIENDMSLYKKEFYIPKDTIYMDGNSLGLMSKYAEESLMQMVEAWKNFGIDGWLQGNNPWFFFAEKLGKMTTPLIGSLPKETVVTGSATINLHQLIATFFKPQGKKVKILTEEFAFPTDIYAIKSQLRLFNLDTEKDLVIVKSRDKKFILEDDIISAMTNEVALIILPVAFYRSGQVLDVRKLTLEAHKRNILIGFDACHSIGILPHNFHKDQVDFAFWCNYKYVNGGPGAEGGLFVHEKNLGKYPALAGWFSSNKNLQFDMSHMLIPGKEVGAYQTGTPHIFSMAPLLGALTLLDNVGIEKIRKTSLELTDYMIQLIEKELFDLGFSIGTPYEHNKRGGHIALKHLDAARICKTLKTKRIIPDFRPPDIIRLAPSPFYTSFLDVLKTIETIKQIMLKKEYLKFKNIREIVS